MRAKHHLPDLQAYVTSASADSNVLIWERVSEVKKKDGGMQTKK